MKISKIVSAAMLISVLSAPAFAASMSLGADVLYNNPRLNRNLSGDEYDFASQHSRYGSTFQDSWKFTVADSTMASVSIYDLETSFGKPSVNRPTNFRQLRQRRGTVDTAKIFDTVNLKLSIFNSRGQLLGQTGEDGTINNLNLLAGSWYTIRVTGKVGGFFGSSYHGVLDINPTQVPLGTTAPLFGSALGMLALRWRKKHASATTV